MVKYVGIKSDRQAACRATLEGWSNKVFRLRIDSDWNSGMGDYYPVNSRSEYTENEWNMDASDRPDISVYHCRSCDHMWE